MKSGKQRRSELDERKQACASKDAQIVQESQAQALEREKAVSVPVNREALALHNSYADPDFVERGFYRDMPFTCVDCGKDEVWAGAQQKWWYEIAKGGVFTNARRCRACRRRERDRRAEARRVHQEGITRKQEPVT